MSYINGPINKYLFDLSAKLPAPGGGSASALVGAAGVALLEMVINFTIGKDGYKEYEEENEIMLERLKMIRRELEKLVDEDVIFYSELSRAYKIPKEDETRAQKIKLATEKALGVPLKIIHLCREALKVSKRIIVTSNKNLITDIGCGVLFLRAALRGAELNARINLKTLKDTEKEKMLETMISDIETIEREILEKTFTYI